MKHSIGGRCPQDFSLSRYTGGGLGRGLFSDAVAGCIGGSPPYPSPGVPGEGIGQHACSRFPWRTTSKLAGNTGRCAALLLLVLVLTTGCITGRQNPAATQPATAIDPKTAQTAYWMAKPAIAEVSSSNFDRLWAAAQDSIRDHSFLIDRTDYREGILTTQPRSSKLFYEFWRNDVVDPYDLTQSTLGTMRRTVRIDVRKADDGSFTASPKVVVERYSMLEKRITSVSQYRDVFSLTTRDLRLDAEAQGEDQVASEFWYAIRRDCAGTRACRSNSRHRKRFNSPASQIRFVRLG